MKHIHLIISLIFVLSIAIACKTEVPKSELLSTKVFNYPILKGKKDNPVLRFAVECREKEQVLSTISVKVKSSNTNDLASVRIYYSGQDSTFNDKVQFGKSLSDNGNFSINGNQTLKEGLNYFWVTCELAENVGLTSKIEVALENVTLDGDKIFPATTSGVDFLRTGVAVRQHWDDDVHTYRIPGLTTTKKGTLLAIYDVRRESGRDLQGHMDIGVSRSTDDGNTWEPMRIALDMGEWGGLPQKFNGVSDACILVDENSEDIYLAGLWMHGVINSEGIWQKNLTEDSKDWNHQWRNKGSQPGFGVKETSQFLIAKSTDDGLIWSEPVNLTKMCKKKEWWLWAPAPGRGITLEDGTLVFPTQGRNFEGESFSNITYSKDGGLTWKTSNQAFFNTTECAVVELNDGSLMLNMRDNRNASVKGPENGRAVFTSKDLGESWTEHPTHHGALIEPRCMASLHKHIYTGKDGEKKSVLFFSNPNSKYKRHKQTVKVSFDDGNTWPERYWMELDEGRGAGYSCLTSINENTIGILYEGSQAHMTFQAIDVSDMMENRNR